MSAIDSVSTSNPPSATNAFDAFGSDEFLRIMLTELSNQDPLAPSDTKEILQQVGTIRSIESDLALTKRLDSLVQQNEVAAAGNLIGKYVAGRTDAGEATENLVVSVSVTREGPLLNLLDGRRMPFENVEEIVDPALFRSAPSNAAGSGDSVEQAR